MIYALVQNQTILEYPLYEGDIRLRYPDTSFPIPFEAPDGYQVVFESEYPDCSFNHKMIEGTPEWVDGTLRRVWQLEDLSDEELQAKIDERALIVRAERNSLLVQSDWTQLSDAPVDQEAWAAYRQQLRDITKQSDFPLEVEWPATPQ